MIWKRKQEKTGTRFEFEDQPTLYIDGVPPNHSITVDGVRYSGEDCNIHVQVRLWVEVSDGPPAGRYENVSMDEEFHQHLVGELLSP